MDEKEKHALKLVKAQTSAKLDPFPVLNALLDRHIISAEQFRVFLQDSSSENGDTMLWHALFDHLQKHCTFLTLIDILMKAGQFGLAQMLIDLIKGDSGDHKIARVYRIQTDKQKSIRIFFRNLKSQVHDASLKNPRETLRNLAERYHTKMSCERDASRKNYLADKLVAILGVEIDAHAITFDNKLSRHELFDELKALMHDSSNTMVTDISYNSRLANAHAIGGRFSEGRDMLVKAHCSASNFTACLEVANMYYVQVYVLLWEFEATRSQRLKYSLLEMAAKGIMSLQEEEDSIRILWTRMFLLRMIFCLLGIGNRANVLPSYSPSQEDIAQAFHLLQNVSWDGIWKGIETRREMFYWVAMSRWNALKGRFTEAQADNLKARNLALSGQFKELAFIVDYSKDLECVASTSQRDHETPEILCGPDPSTEAPINPGNDFSHELNYGLHSGSNCAADCRGLESYKTQSCLSGHSGGQNFEDESILFQQTDENHRFERSLEHIDSDEVGRCDELRYRLLNQNHNIQNLNGLSRSVYSIQEFCTGNGETDITSPYNSDLGQSVLHWSYLRHMEDDDCKNQVVYLFHQAAASRQNGFCADSGKETCEIASDPHRNMDTEENISLNFPDCDPYDSLDSMLLFGSETHEPGACFNSLVLFEDRGEPEGDSIT